MRKPTKTGRPDLVAVAGANGAGKSTVGARLLKETLGIGQFVNADDIARGLSGFAPESAAFEAGRIMLRWIGELARRRETFALWKVYDNSAVGPARPVAVGSKTAVVEVLDMGTWRRIEGSTSP